MKKLLCSSMAMILLFLVLFQMISPAFASEVSASAVYTEKWNMFSTSDGKTYSVYVVSDAALAEIYGRPLSKQNDAPHIVRIYVEDEKGIPVEDLQLVMELVLDAQSSSRYIKDATTDDTSRPILPWHVQTTTRTDDEGNRYFVAVPQVMDWYRDWILYPSFDDNDHRIEIWKQVFLKLALQEELYNKIDNVPECMETLKAILEKSELPFDAIDLILSGYATVKRIPPDMAGKFFLKDLVNILKKIDRRLAVSVKSLTKHLGTLWEKIGTYISAAGLALDITGEALRLLYLGSIANAQAEDRLEVIKWVVDNFALLDPAIKEACTKALEDFQKVYQQYCQGILNCIKESLGKKLVDIIAFIASLKAALVVAPYYLSYQLIKWMFDVKNLVECSSLAATLQQFMKAMLKEQQKALSGKDPKPLEEIDRTMNLFQINYYLGFSYYKDYLAAVDNPVTKLREWLDPATKEALRSINEKKEENSVNAQQLLSPEYLSGWEWKGWADWTWLTQEAGLKLNFHISVKPDSFLYKPSETTITTIEVTNLRGETTNYWLGVSFQDPYGESKTYDPQISLTPQSANLKAGESIIHTIRWTVPFDAPLGVYSITVNCWTDSTYSKRFEDNLDVWKPIFLVYKLVILAPTANNPVSVGTPTNPRPIQVGVVTRIPFLPKDAFKISIGSRNAAFARAMLPALPIDFFPGSSIFADILGFYAFDVETPIQEQEGAYDLTISVNHDQINDVAVEKQAVRYTLVPPAIEKGLAWLRTKQQSDGSWSGWVGVTSLATLAFLNAGYDETDPTVKKAIQYIIGNVKADGSIYNHDESITYETSLAIITLVATHNDTYRGAIENAKKWLVNSQWDESCLWGSVNKDNWYYGGFGYGHGQRPDLSNTQFALLALDAAGLPKDDPLWTKVQVFLHRCQNIAFTITLNIDKTEYTVQPYNTQGGYDGGFIYHPGTSLAEDQKSYGSMTGAGIWGLLLSGVPMNDPRVVAAVDWVKNHYTWDGNPGMPDPTSMQYYYYLTMSKALLMAGSKYETINGHDWYQELYEKLKNLQPDGYWVNPNNRDMEDAPELVTAYSILSLQTRITAPPIGRLSYVTFILRSAADLNIHDPKGKLVGIDYITNLATSEVPNAVYSGPGSEPQYILTVNPIAGEYNLELAGRTEGSYELTIEGYHGDTVTYSKKYSGNISRGEILDSDAVVSSIVGAVWVHTTQPTHPAIGVKPKEWVSQAFEGQSISTDITINETTNLADIHNVVLTASNLTDEYGHTVPGSAFSFSENNFTIPKGGSKVITISLTIPQDIAVGSYRGTVFISSDGGNALIMSFISIIHAPIEVLDVSACDASGNPKSSFSIGTLASFKVTVKNAGGPRSVLITVNAFDSGGQTLGVASFQGVVSQGESTFIISLPISQWAIAGTATVYADIFEMWGGPPLSEEKSSTFGIT